ncbi:MAG: DUF6484 domain-containing protein [Polyangiaceae bacterium]
MSNGERAGDPEAPEGTYEGEAEETIADDEPGESLVELLLAQREPASPPPLAARVDGVVVGRIAGFEPDGSPRVTFSGAPAAGFPARSTTPLSPDDEGREVALLFESGDPHRPIVMGKMVSPLAPASGDAATEAAADGKRVEISAEQEIVLRCGDSSITLTRAGKILIRGAYVLSRSSGVNRIQGGSVEIN